MLHRAAIRWWMGLMLCCGLAGNPAYAQVVEVKPEKSSYFESLQTDSAHPVSQRTLPDSVLQRLLRDDAYWYANTAPAPKKDAKKQDQSKKTVLQQNWFRNLVWFFIIAVFVGLVIWYLAASNIRLFRKASTVIADEDQPLTEEDIFSLAYESEIDKAVGQQNFRLAVRLLYLQTLKELADRNIIDFRHEKTNRDYLFQLSGTGYYRNFFRLTRDFEYTWYGKFPLSPEAFALIRNNFSTFKQQLQG